VTTAEFLAIIATVIALVTIVGAAYRIGRVFGESDGYQRGFDHGAEVADRVNRRNP
jgi:hypothetical protein